MELSLSDELPASANEERTEFIPTRASLLSRLKDGTADEGWREFFEIYWKLIYNTARRSGFSANRPRRNPMCSR